MKHLILKSLRLGTLGWTIAAYTLILFLCSSLKHALFQSNALDLGWFDQAVYLISQGQVPIVSFGGFHVLGDHAAWILYPLALLYKIYPAVHWLLAVQAIALSLAAIPLWHLARQAGLKPTVATAIATAYLLYPLVFNINSFDFHPEVLAVPALFSAVLAARSGKIGWFCAAILVVLGCKAVLSLTIVGLGIWLLLFEARAAEAPIRSRMRIMGAIALVAGISWFLLATQVIIPYFRADKGSQVSAIAHYQYLGSSVTEIAKNLVLQPGLVLSHLFTQANLEYLALLFIPVLWGLSLRHLTPLIATLPALALNLLSTMFAAKNLTTQYSLPILPFLFIAIVAALAHQQGWVQQRRGIILCALVGFLALAKYSYFGTLYLRGLDTWQATRTALSQIPTQGTVLTVSQIAPHLTHRPIIKLAVTGSQSRDLTEFDYVLLNARHPGWASDRATITQIVAQLKQDPTFQATYQQDEVYLFTHKS